MKVTRKKNKKREDGNGKGLPDLKHPNKKKRICKGFSNGGMLGRRF
jgi:hypothetical protein|tara:strand:- start:397 stop:534 length:138 start_codon:yes stop_codon:yes gene_type:complete